MRRIRLAIHAATVLALLSGCYTVVYPNQPKPVHPDGDAAIWAVEKADATPLVYNDYDLCAFAADAVHLIIVELSQADDLVKQTVASYRKYAQTLRGIAAKADKRARQQAILRAAAAADQYAREVERRKSYTGVDIEPAVKASQAAFPGCDLD